MISSWEAGLFIEFESLARDKEVQEAEASMAIEMKQVIRVELFILSLASH
jgi:hypothetical protein